jgi:threonine dehydrogenase-like Zn-dependent dehydrogenase
MPAAVLADVGTLAVVERPLPRVEAADDVIVEVEACGVCGTDLKILSIPPGHPATPGVVLGHEFVGVVVETGEAVAARAPGDRVVVAPNVSCGQCPWCRRGLRNHCERFTTIGIYADGGLAPRVRVPAANCHPISVGVPAHLAALAEPLSTVVAGVRRAEPFPGDLVAVIGAGPVGLMFTALLTLAGASVAVVEPVAERAALAQRMGAEHAWESAPAGIEADIVVDCVGSQFPAALDLVRKAGRIVLFGFDLRARAEIAQERITRDELTVVGSFVGQGVFPTAIRLLEQGRLDLEPLVTHRIAVQQLPDALEELRAGRAVKVEVEF